jgi:transcriptional regulator with XRE-family HTH domain
MLKSSQILAEFRRSKGLTQQELAEKIGVSRQTIAMWEIDKRLPTDSVAILTARFLGIDEENFLLRLQNERLKLRVERLQAQYGATIIIVNQPNQGGTTMKNIKQRAKQTQQGVTFAVTRIYKSVDFEYSPKKEPTKRGDDFFNGLFELHHPGEQLIVKMVVTSADEAFHLNCRYVGYCDIVDNFGNHYWPQGMGMHVVDEGKVIQGFSHFGYTCGAQSITLRHKIANSSEDNCDFILFEDVKLNEEGIVKNLNGVTITYNGVQLPDYNGKSHQIRIQLNERANSQYVGITRVTDNLSNEYLMTGWSWTLGEKTAETFHFDKPLAPEATSISFKYFLAKTVLNFELLDLPLPS